MNYSLRSFCGSVAVVLGALSIVRRQSIKFADSPQESDLRNLLNLLFAPNSERSASPAAEYDRGGISTSLK